MPVFVMNKTNQKWKWNGNQYIAMNAQKWIKNETQHKKKHAQTNARMKKERQKKTSEYKISATTEAS